MVHGDDFIISGKRESIHWLHQEISKKLISKLRGILGPDPGQGDIKDDQLQKHKAGILPIM